MLHGHFFEAQAELHEASDLDQANENVQQQMDKLNAVIDEQYLGSVRNRAGRKKNKEAKYLGNVPKNPLLQKTKC